MEVAEQLPADSRVEETMRLPLPLPPWPRLLLLLLLLLSSLMVDTAIAFPTSTAARTFPPPRAVFPSIGGARTGTSLGKGGESRVHYLHSDAALGMVSRSTTIAAEEAEEAQEDEQDPSSLSSSSTSSSTSSSRTVIPRSVNYFISRRCNYSCEFCFHTAKTYHTLPLEDSAEGLRKLAEAGCEKINFAGGEPFLHPILLGELCRIASDELGLGVSIISNGSKITPEWMNMYAKHVDVLGVSVDSFDKATNAAIGRGGDAENGHVERMLRVRDECSKHNVRFKLNTVVNSLNWEEDMNHQIAALDPFRWKVFQVLLLEGENVGGDGDLRDARHLCIDRTKFESFVERHADRHQLIPEPNDVMQNSYLLLDEEMRFLDCSGGGKVPGRSILDVGVDKALMDAGFDDEMFTERGGVFEWRRPRDE